MGSGCFFSNPACRCFAPGNTGWVATVSWECIWLRFMAHICRGLRNVFNISWQHYFCSLPLMACDSSAATLPCGLRCFCTQSCFLSPPPHHYLSRVYIQIKVSGGWLQPRRGFRGKGRQDVAPFYHSGEREAQDNSPTPSLFCIFLSRLNSRSLCCVTVPGSTDVLTRSFYSCASLSQMFIHGPIIPILPRLNFKNNFTCSWYRSLFSP